jgi:branched-subunit amino acid ABC-type transport system permease component
VSLALQIVITGLAAGGVYGVVAIGYTLIYRLTGVVQLALGVVAQEALAGRVVGERRHRRELNLRTRGA